MILKSEYFSSPATTLAPDLLGKLLCRRLADGSIIKARIVETECYFGEEDTACHAHKGKTERTRPMYESGGITYVYLCYGIHSLLNIVTGDEGHPEAVLIRGVEGALGPGKLTKLLKITVKNNFLPLTEESGIWVEDDGTKPTRITKLPRVGIDYADKPDRDRKWRYTVKN